MGGCLSVSTNIGVDDARVSHPRSTVCAGKGAGTKCHITPGSARHVFVHIISRLIASCCSTCSFLISVSSSVRLARSSRPKFRYTLAVFPHCLSTTATSLFCWYTHQCTILHFCHAMCCLPSVLPHLQLGCMSHMQEQTAPSTTKVKVFKLLLDTYVYSTALGTFIPLPSMPPKLPAQLCAAAKALQEIEHGKPKALPPCPPGSPSVAPCPTTTPEPE